MPKNIPSQFTGRFSIKPKKSSSKLRNATSAPDAQDAPSMSPPSSECLPDNLRDEQPTFHERKRKLSSEGEPSGKVKAPARNDKDELGIYSQQLEVQSPPDQHMSDLTEQSEPQEAASSTTTGERSAHCYPPSQVSSLEIEEPHQYQIDTASLFRTTWKAAGEGQPSISAAARTLSRRVTTATDPGAGNYVWSIIRAFKHVTSEEPQALDCTLQIYCEAIKIFPDSVVNKYGNGSEATIQQLKWLLIEEVNGFDGFLLPNSAAKVDTADRSSLKFKYADVDANLDGVLAQIHDWRYQRRMWLIATAGMARLFSLNILRRKNGEHIESLIDSGFSRKQPCWSKADMVGACTMLRGCARSLLKVLVEKGAERKLSVWKNALERFLLQDDETWDNDFIVKAHAAVSNALHGSLSVSLTNFGIARIAELARWAF